MWERKTSAGDSSSRATGSSKGLMWCSEVSEMLKYLPPVALAIYSYSRSGSKTKISTSNIKERNISNFVKYDFPLPLLAKIMELKFSKEKRSNNTKEELWRLMP